MRLLCRQFGAIEKLLSNSIDFALCQCRGTACTGTFGVLKICLDVVFFCFVLYFASHCCETSFSVFECEDSTFKDLNVMP